MIFMPHWEVFAVLKKLWEISCKAKTSKTGSEDYRLKWHIAATNKEHAQVVMTYIDFYADKKIYTGHEKALMKKCEELGINFDKIVDMLLSSLMTAVVPIDLAIYIVNAYLLEG